MVVYPTPGHPRAALFGSDLGPGPARFGWPCACAPRRKIGERELPRRELRARLLRGLGRRGLVSPQFVFGGPPPLELQYLLQYNSIN